MDLTFRLLRRAAALALLAWVPATAYAESTRAAGEAYYFLIPEATDDRNDPVYVYDAEQDRVLRAAPGQGALARLARDGWQSVRSPEWVVLLNQEISRTFLLISMDIYIE